MEKGGEGRAAGPRRDEVIADDGEDRDEALQAAGRSEPLHRSLASAQGQM
jgi:hypothetical protein